MELIFYRHNINGYANEIKKQKIAFNELTFVLKGKLTYYVDDKEYILQPNDIVYIPKEHFRKRLKEDVCDYVSFNYDGEENDIPSFIQNGVTPEIKRFISCADGINEKYFANKIYQIQLILENIFLIIKEELKTQDTNPLITKIKGYIKDHLNEKITLLDIGKSLYFSPIYCDSVFKKQTGTSIICYINDQKIEEGKKLLIESSLTVTKISEQLGFVDNNYFVRLFKKKTKYTPLQFRKNYFGLN